MSNLPTPQDRPYLGAIDRTARGLGRFELTSFFAHPKAISQWCQDVITYFHLSPSSGLPPPNNVPKVDAIIGLDALGFPLAGALSVLTGIPVILARKGGKIPLPSDEILSTEQFGDYAVARLGMKSLEIRKSLLKEGMNVILVDEWIDTGTQMTSLCNLLEVVKVRVVGIATLNYKEGKHHTGDKLWEGYEVFAGTATPMGTVATWQGSRALR